MLDVNVTLIEAWLQCLDDDRVIAKLREVLGIDGDTKTESNRQLLEKVEDLENKLQMFEIKNAHLRRELKSIQELNNQLQSNADKLELYNGLDTVYSSYMALKLDYPNVVRDLHSIVCEDTPIAFIYSLFSSIGSFYDWINNHLSTPNVPIGALADVYNWALEQYCICKSENYQTIDVSIGDAFNSSIHFAGINCRGGRVKKVIVKGYRSLDSQEVMKKSIVEVD